MHNPNVTRIDNLQGHLVNFPLLCEKGTADTSIPIPPRGVGIAAPYRCNNCDCWRLGDTEFMPPWLCVERRRIAKTDDS